MAKEQLSPIQQRVKRIEQLNSIDAKREKLRANIDSVSEFTPNPYRKTPKTSQQIELQKRRITRTILNNNAAHTVEKAAKQIEVDNYNRARQYNDDLQYYINQVKSAALYFAKGIITQDEFTQITADYTSFISSSLADEGIKQGIDLVNQENEWQREQKRDAQSQQVTVFEVGSKRSIPRNASDKEKRRVSVKDKGFEIDKGHYIGGKAGDLLKIVQVLNNAGELATTRRLTELLYPGTKFEKARDNLTNLIRSARDKLKVYGYSLISQRQDVPKSTNTDSVYMVVHTDLAKSAERVIKPHAEDKRNSKRATSRLKKDIEEAADISELKFRGEKNSKIFKAVTGHTEDNPATIEQLCRLIYPDVDTSIAHKRLGVTIAEINRVLKKYGRRIHLSDEYIGESNPVRYYIITALGTEKQNKSFSKPTNVDKKDESLIQSIFDEPKFGELSQNDIASLAAALQTHLNDFNKLLKDSGLAEIDETTLNNLLVFGDQTEKPTQFFESEIERKNYKTQHDKVLMARRERALARVNKMINKPDFADKIEEICEGNKDLCQLMRDLLAINSIYVKYENITNGNKDNEILSGIEFLSKLLTTPTNKRAAYSVIKSHTSI